MASMNQTQTIWSLSSKATGGEEMPSEAKASETYSFETDYELQNKYTLLAKMMSGELYKPADISYEKQTEKYLATGFDWYKYANVSLPENLPDLLNG